MWLGELAKKLGIGWEGKIDHALSLPLGDRNLSLRRICKDLDDLIALDTVAGHKFNYHKAQCLQQLGEVEGSLKEMQTALIRSENPRAFSS